MSNMRGRRKQRGVVQVERVGRDEAYLEELAKKEIQSSEDLKID